MKSISKIHLIIILAINLILILILINFTWNGNDKAIILTVIGYLLLIIINAIIWLVLNYYKKSEYRIYKITTISLVILFIPMLIVSSMY